MKRAEFLGWLESQLRARGVPVRRWTVHPGLEDLEIQNSDGKAVRLRTVRTSPPGGESGQASGE